MVAKMLPETLSIALQMLPNLAKTSPSIALKLPVAREPARSSAFSRPPKVFPRTTCRWPLKGICKEIRQLHIIRHWQNPKHASVFRFATTMVSTLSRSSRSGTLRVVVRRTKVEG